MTRSAFYAATCRLLILAGLGLSSEILAAGACNGDSARYHIMPKTIGSPGEISKTPYALPCDSMLVPEGQTTTIYAASIVHFGTNPSLASRIIVKGELLVEGTENSPAYFSGSVKNSEVVGYVPGTQVWDGIEVDSGAVIRFDHARIFNAPTPMVFFSNDAVLRDCYFQGGSSLILPDKNLVLNSKGQTIPEMDLRGGSKASIPMASDSIGSKADPKVKRGGSRSMKPLYYTATGIGILAAAGIAWFVMDGSSKSNSTPPTDKLQPDPELPPIPSPRKP